MAQSCSITAHFLHRLRDEVANQEDLLFTFMELVESCAQSSVSPLVMQLRAFYVVEVLYNLALPAVCIPRALSRDLNNRAGVNSIDAQAAGGRILHRVMAWRFDRSYDGMTQLLEKLQQLRDDTEVEDAAVALNLNIDAGMRVLRQNMAEPWAQVVQALDKAARAARHALNDSADSAWGVLGTQLHCGCSASHMTLDARLEHARVLLTIDTHHVVHPWDKVALWNRTPNSRG